MTVTEIVKDNKAIFSHYRNGLMYYDVLTPNMCFVCSFPIDITDTKDIGSATLEKSHKAITLMRYIRKATKDETILFTKIG